MSEALPALAGGDVVKAFVKLGFVLPQIHGSHHILLRKGHPRPLSVPVHGARTVKRGTLSGLIAASGFTREEFLQAVLE